MKKLLNLFFLILVSSSSVLAQDAELSKLMDAVRGLRSGGRDAFEKAAETMSADKAWTPMNELKASDASAECRASDRVPGFRLNRMLAAAEQKRRFETTTGNMLNGENPNFCYSLYERAVKASSTLSYTLRARSGEQCFVLMPFDSRKSAGLKFTVSAGSRALDMTETKDACVFTGKVREGETVKITITNTSDKPRSFAIFNYNSRK